MRRDTERKFYGFDLGRMWYQTCPGGWHITFQFLLGGFTVGRRFWSFYRDGVETSVSFSFFPNWPFKEGEFYYRWVWERRWDFIPAGDLI